MTTTTRAGACTDGRCSPPRAASCGIGQSVGRAPTAGGRAGEYGPLPSGVTTQFLLRQFLLRPLMPLVPGNLKVCPTVIRETSRANRRNSLLFSDGGH